MKRPAVSCRFRTRGRVLLVWLEGHGYGDLHDLSMYASLAEEAGPLTEYTARDEANKPLWRALYNDSPLVEYVDWWMGLDLPAGVPRLEIPALLMTGRRDYKAPLELVAEYVATLEAPAGKRLIPFQHSAHVVFLEERTLFRNTMIDAATQYGR